MNQLRLIRSGNWLLPGLLILALGTGCATAPGPDPAEVAAPPEPAPTAPVESLPSNALAVESLLEQAREHYRQADFSAAIAAAERGLRIDRRMPELYLLLAQSYFQLAMPHQADEFARQGLRYTDPNSVLAEALQAMRDLVASNVPLRF